MAAACARQGYEPQYVLAAEVILDRFKDDPNLEGVLGSSSVLPWFATGTPAADEFRGALQAYGANVVAGVGTVTGWTAGKLLERAGRNLPEPPTAEALLQELWTIRGDELGGLTYPLTFREGKPSERKTCWFNLAVRDEKWHSPDGYQRYCGQ